jgi:hypothetical protein
MFELFDNETGDLIGEITAEQLQFLKNELEETAETDRDYFLHAPALAMLEEAGAEADLLEMLEGALGERDGMEIRWEAVTED